MCATLGAGVLRCRAVLRWTLDRCPHSTWRPLLRFVLPLRFVSYQAPADGGPLNPTTAVALEVLKRASVSVAGFSATAMYARVEAAETALEEERREREKVTAYLNAVMKEVCTGGVGQYTRPFSSSSRGVFRLCVSVPVAAQAVPLVPCCYRVHVRARFSFPSNAWELILIRDQMEVKMPLIEQQRQDYERALASHEQLSIRLDNAMRESSDKEKAMALLRGQIEESKKYKLILQQEVRSQACDVAQHRRRSWRVE